MRTMRTRADGELRPGVTTCRPARVRDQIPAPRTEREVGHQVRADRGAGQQAETGQQAEAGQDAGQMVTTLYRMHYRSLVRLAALLVSDVGTAEDIVQDSFAAMHGMGHALPDTDAALCYLRRSVVRRTRSAPRRQPAGDTHAPGGPEDGGPEDGEPEDGEPEDGGPGRALPGSAVMSALRALPARQREVLVLRYFADLPEAEIASATGMSIAAVRSQAARALSSVHAELHPAAGGRRSRRLSPARTGRAA